MSEGHLDRMYPGFRWLLVQNPNEPSIVLKHEPEKKKSDDFHFKRINLSNFTLAIPRDSDMSNWPTKSEWNLTKGCAEILASCSFCIFSNNLNLLSMEATLSSQTWMIAFTLASSPLSSTDPEKSR